MIGRAAIAGLALVAVLGATSCSSSDRADVGGASSTPPVRSPLLDDVGTFALGLGADPDDVADQVRLGAHDLVVIDGDAATADVVDALHADGAVVLAYLSVGTVEPYRRWYDEAKQAGLLLDRFEEWDEDYAAVDRPATRALLAREARRILARGADGLFLDNVDMVDTHPAQRDGMRRLVADLDRIVGGDRVLFSQNGDPIELGIVDHLDGWNREDVSFTYDFDASGYVPVPPADRRAAAAMLRRVRAQGLLTTATDYLPEVDEQLVAEAVATACAAGAVPFVGDIELEAVPDRPLACPR